MRKWIFNILAVLSFVLLLLTSTLWARSYFISDWVACEWQTSKVGVQVWVYSTAPGSFGVMKTNSEEYESYTPGKWHWWRTTDELDKFGLGFKAERHWEFDFRYRAEYVSWMVAPFWSLVFAFGILPWIWYMGHKKRKRLMAIGHCKKCAYNLKYNTTGECPECGESNEL